MFLISTQVDVFDFSSLFVWAFNGWVCITRKHETLHSEHSKCITNNNYSLDENYSNKFIGFRITKKHQI